MKFLKIALATAAIAGFASTASAQDSSAYVNVGIDTYEFDVYNLGGKVGYNFTENFGVEGQASFGISSKDSIKVKSAFGGFAVARMPLSEQFDVFVRGGYHSTSVGVNGFSGSANLDGFAVGGGAQYFFTANDGIRVEYTYLDADGGSADTAGISYVRKF